jgi:hypothetical protein
MADESLGARQIRLGVGGFGLGARRFRLGACRKRSLSIWPPRMRWCLPSALPAGRRDRQRAVRRARPTGSGPVPGALGETGTPPGRHGCLSRRPRKQNRWPLSGSPCRIDTDRSRLTGVRLIIWGRLARLCRICSVSLPRLWHEQRTTYYEARRNFNILNVGSLDVVQIRRSTEQYIFLPTPSL